jgi:hypothetical protein
LCFVLVLSFFNFCAGFLSLISYLRALF